MADYKKIKQRRENSWMIKSDKELKNKLDELRRIRFSKGLDIPKPAGYNEILKASFRFKPLLEILKQAEFKEELK